MSIRQLALTCSINTGKKSRQIMITESAEQEGLRLAWHSAEPINGVTLPVSMQIPPDRVEELKKLMAGIEGYRGTFDVYETEEFLLYLYTVHASVSREFSLFINLHKRNGSGQQPVLDCVQVILDRESMQRLDVFLQGYGDMTAPAPSLPAFGL